MTTKLRGHSDLGGSSMARVIECPGSAALCSGMPDEDTEYSVEGSLAHRVAEKALISGEDTVFYLGKHTLLENGNGDFIKQEMVDFVGVYVNAIRALVVGVDGQLEVEKQVHLDWLHKDFWGSIDAIVKPDFGDTLYVIDLKYGVGVPVPVEHNTQLKFYGLGALGPMPKKGDTWKFVKVGICQPRINADPPIAWADPIPVDELRAWGDTVLLPAAKKARGRNPPTKPGEHCRWCKAVSICPQTRTALVEVEKSVVAEPILTPEFIARMLEVKPRIEQLMKKVYCVGLDILKAGGEVPGFKLVRGKADRKWKDGALETLEMLLSEKDLYTEPKLKSPAQMEIVWTEKGGKKAQLASIIEKPEGNITIVPVSDKRPTVTAASASDVFNSETEE